MLNGTEINTPIFVESSIGNNANSLDAPQEEKT
jgi:hypothetical protein